MTKQKCESKFDEKNEMPTHLHGCICCNAANSAKYVIPFYSRNERCHFLVPTHYLWQEYDSENYVYKNSRPVK